MRIKLLFILEIKDNLSKASDFQYKNYLRWISVQWFNSEIESDISIYMTYEISICVRQIKNFPSIKFSCESLNMICGATKFMRSKVWIFKMPFYSLRLICTTSFSPGFSKPMETQVRCNYLSFFSYKPFW